MEGSYPYRSCLLNGGAAFTRSRQFTCSSKSASLLRSFFLVVLPRTPTLRFDLPRAEQSNETDLHRFDVQRAWRRYGVLVSCVGLWTGCLLNVTGSQFDLTSRCSPSRWTHQPLSSRHLMGVYFMFELPCYRDDGQSGCMRHSPQYPREGTISSRHLWGWMERRT